MDVSTVIVQQAASQAAKYKSVEVSKETPLEPDVGLLAITDPNPIDVGTYAADLEAHLQALARDGVQALLAQVFSLPTKPSVHGPLAILPPQTTRLPRSKPLPKQKPMSKWQKFANTKGIQHRKRDKRVFDEEKQEWVNRWGKDGKNKELEKQWLHEIPSSKPDDYDPVIEARQKRKERVAKNEESQKKNASHAARTSSRSTDIERVLVRARASTASMGQFDKQLEGEKKPRGIKRKFAPTEQSENERTSSLTMISKLDGRPASSKKVKPSRLDPGKTEDVLNVRKAVKFASRGGGSLSLARSTEKVKRKVSTKSSRKRIMKTKKRPA